MSHFIYYYAECGYAEFRYAECRYAECRYAECRSVPAKALTQTFSFSVYIFAAVKMRFVLSSFLF
jgi:hypothetical protein